MKTPNRDLLVLVKDDHLNEKAMEFEVDQINRLLMVFETVDNLCTAHEVFDLNSYRIHNDFRSVRKVISDQHLKPFVFICNKN